MYADGRPMRNTGDLFETYSFILQYVNERGFSPSYVEIAEATGISSTNTIYTRLKRLEQMGLIERPIKGSPRAIRIIYGGD